jgi:hypothetical protein
MALVTLQDYRFTLASELKDVTKSEAMQKYIKESFANVNMRETFSHLVDCGSLLQIALTAAGEQPCSVGVLRTLSEYQNIVGDSMVVSGAFVEGTLVALRGHVAAAQAFDEAETAEDLADGLEELDACATLACNMAAKSDELATKVDKLMKLAEECLTQAKQDSVNNSEQSKKIADKLADLQAEKAGREKTLDLLTSDLQDAIEKDQKMAAKAAEARDRQFKLEMTGAILGSVGNAMNPWRPIILRDGKQEEPKKETASEQSGSPTEMHLATVRENARSAQGELENLNSKLKSAENAEDKETPDGKKKITDLEEQIEKQKKVVHQIQETMSNLSVAMDRRAESLEAQEAQASKMRHELSKQRNQLAGALAKNITEMETMREDKTQVEQTVITLASCMQTMGMVKTTFVSTKMFWEMVASKCHMLAGMKENFERTGKQAGKDMDRGHVERGKKKLKDCVFQSAQCWAGVGSVCLEAHTAINDAREKVNGVMCKLPSGEATEQEIKKLVGDMQPRLRAIQGDTP